MSVLRKHSHGGRVMTYLEQLMIEHPDYKRIPYTKIPYGCPDKFFDVSIVCERTVPLTACKRCWNMDNAQRYCGHCGAKMDLEEETE